LSGGSAGTGFNTCADSGIMNSETNKTREAIFMVNMFLLKTGRGAIGYLGRETSLMSIFAATIYCFCLWWP